jgi:hypothetical protein
MRAALALLASVVLAAGCASRPHIPGARRAWSNALTEAGQYAAANEFARADSVLQAFAAAHPTSADTVTVLFYRALYSVDPANPAEDGVATATALIDRYLAANTAHPHRYEALALRRFAELRSRPPVVRVDTVRTIDTAAVRSAVAREVEARDRTRDEEAQRLRDSLTRATAELDRIRRRLARP